MTSTTPAGTLGRFEPGGVEFQLLANLIAIKSVPCSLLQNDCLDLLADFLKHPAIEIELMPLDWDLAKSQRSRRGEALYLPIEHRDPNYEQVLPKLRALKATIGRGDGPTLVICGHVDVVPAYDADWTSDPFTPTVVEGCLVGRGTFDMKGGVVAAAAAMRDLAERADELPGRVVFLAVPEEESGGNGTLAAVAAGVVGDGWVFTEGTDLAIVHRHFGIASFRIDIEGRAGGMLRHSWGQSANDALGRVLIALTHLERARNELARTGGEFEDDDNPGFVNCGIVGGGDWLATRAAHAYIQGLMSVLPDETPTRALEDMRTAVAAIDFEDIPWFVNHPPEVSAPEPGHPGALIEEAHPLVQSLLSAAHLDPDNRVEVARVGVHVCDAKIVSGGGFAPSVVFGPVGGGLHAADEWVDLSSLQVCTESLVVSAMTYLSQQSER